MSGEEWRPIPGWEGLYEVSNLGRVRSLDRFIECMSRWGKLVRRRKRGCVLKPVKNSGDHCFVALGRANLMFVHRLVLFAFVGPCPKGMETRHLDGDANNNRLTNLVWGTRLENMADRKRLGEENPPRGIRSHRATLTEKDVLFIRRERRKGRSFGVIAKSLGVTRNAVGKVALGLTWGWLQ